MLSTHRSAVDGMYGAFSQAASLNPDPDEDGTAARCSVILMHCCCCVLLLTGHLTDCGDFFDASNIEHIVFDEGDVRLRGTGSSGAALDLSALGMDTERFADGDECDEDDDDADHMDVAEMSAFHPPH